MSNFRRISNFGILKVHAETLWLAVSLERLNDIHFGI